MESSWTRVCLATEVPAEGMHAVQVGEWQVLVVHSGEQLFAFNDCCPHQSARLSGGRMRRGSLMCPLHGARFEITSGRCVGGAYPPLLVLPVRERDGLIEVDMPLRKPTPEETPH